MDTNMNSNSICKRFGQLLNGEGKMKNGVCSVSLHRTFGVKINGKDASSILEVSAFYQDLDRQGNALNFAIAAVLQEEVPAYTHVAIRQGIIVSALHNHWLYTNPPQIMFVHLQSIEPPLQFAQKMAYAFSQLKSPPVAKK